MTTFPTSEKNLSQIPALQLLANLSYQVLTPDKALAERSGKTSMLLEGVLREQIAKQYHKQKRGLMQKLLTGEWRIRARLEYPDLMNAEDVYRGLLGYGMFSDKLPPCFSSKSLLVIENNINDPSPHSYVSYLSTRNTNIARQLAVPHPESYLVLCKKIKDNWKKINKHIGKPDKKFNFCHVRKIKDKNHIFEMNYGNLGKWEKEEIEQEYYLGCSYVVKADISTCFQSIYSHSIPWSIQGKDRAKKNRKSSHWSNDIDKAVRNCKDGETNGILIGPHASNIISEIILTQVDCYLQKNKFKKIIRHIDDYIYFAKDENDARMFIRHLELGLKEYELMLNQKKTEVISLAQYFSDEWAKKLASFNFHQKDEIGYTTVNAYLNYAISLANETKNFATINYAIKVISKKKLSDRAKKLYVKKILALSLIHPYLIPLLEKHVFHFSSRIKEELRGFLEPLFSQSLKQNVTDALAFCFYYAIKYEVKINKANKKYLNEVIALGDCVSILLAWKYAKKFSLDTEHFNQKAEDIKNLGEREQDQFWLFLYEHATEEKEIPDGQCFLKSRKKENITFLDFEQS